MLHMPARFAAILVLLLGVAGCSSYDPPVQGDHNSDRYKADLEACRTSSTEAVRLKNADTPGTWILSPFTGPPAVRAAIRDCMTKKGYVIGKDISWWDRRRRDPT